MRMVCAADFSSLLHDLDASGPRVAQNLGRADGVAMTVLSAMMSIRFADLPVARTRS